MSLISILVPAYNEEDNVRVCYERIAAVVDNLPGDEAEIIFTDNHSTDRTFAILSQIAAEDPRVRVFRFSRNVGYQNSVMYAYKAALGDCAIQPPLSPGLRHILTLGNLEDTDAQWAIANTGCLGQSAKMVGEEFAGEEARGRVHQA